MNDAVTHSELKRNSFSCFPKSAPVMPSEMFGMTVFNQTSTLLAYLFQLLFILFIISPPLIVIMLFLIWKELKARNKMK